MMDRKGARNLILQAANDGRPIQLKPFSMRTLQQAVFKVRQKKLVEDVVLVTAGFRA